LGEPVVHRALPLYVSGGIYLSDVALGLLLVVSLLAWPFKTIGPRAFVLPLIGLVALAYLTAIPALVPSFAFYSAGRWLLALLVFLWLVQPTIDAPHTVRVFLAGMMLHVLVAIFQVLGQSPLGLPGELALPPAVSGAAIISTGQERWLRAYGLTFHPNVLGGFLAVAVIIGLPLLRRWYWKIVWVACWLGLFLTFSRAAWIAAVVGSLPVMVWLYRHKSAWRRHMAFSLAGALVVLVLSGIIWWPQLSVRLQPLSRLLPEAVSTPVAAPISPYEARSIDERVDFVRLSLDLIAERPLVGVGAGSFPVAIVEQELMVTAQYAHLVLLNLAAEVGVLGALLWLCLWVAGGWYLIRHWRQDDPWLVAFLSAWLALGMISLFDSYPWSLNAGRLLSMFVLGLAANRLAGIHQNRV